MNYNKINHTILSQLSHTIVFRGFQDDEIWEALQCLRYRIAHYEKEALILQEGDRTNELGILLDGHVRIERIDYMGNRNILSHVSQGQIFAETYAFLDEEVLLVDVVSGTECNILYIDVHRSHLANIQDYAWYPALLMNLLILSDQKNLELSRRNFHTFSKHVRGRILSYLSEQARQEGSPEFDIPYNRQQLADYLNLDRSALSKELCKMRDEKLLSFHKNHFSLKMSQENLPK